jgi:hypothetical protein
MASDKELECTVCNDSFSSIDKLNLHKKTLKDKVEIMRAKIKISRSKLSGIGISAIAIVVIGLYLSQGLSTSYNFEGL